MGHHSSVIRDYVRIVYVRMYVCTDYLLLATSCVTVWRSRELPRTKVRRGSIDCDNGYHLIERHASASVVFRS